MGQAAGAIDSVLPAQQIMDSMVADAVQIFKQGTASISKL